MNAAAVYDVVVIGAGMAGVSLAYRIAGMGSVLVLEGESQPGCHSTGRSAAMFMETYGTATTRALTRAGREFLTHPPDGFTESPLIRDRGVLYLVREGQESMRDAFLADNEGQEGVGMIPVEEVLRYVPCVRPEGLIGAVTEWEAKDLDVHGLLQGFYKGARRAGVEFTFNSQVIRAEREEGTWLLHLNSGNVVRACSVVNASGAWAQVTARLFGAIETGLQPRRRSAFTFPPVCGEAGRTLEAREIENWPAVVGIDESFYFKPDAGQLLGSPANADDTFPHDVVAEELDIAIGIDRITSATTLQIRRPSHTWAGLRSFVPDGDFVIGWDPQAEGFFWLAAQGGYGIQTSPGASLLAADLLLRRPLSPELVQEGVYPQFVSPDRFK